MTEYPVRAAYGRRRFLAALLVAGLGTGIGVAVDSLVTDSDGTKTRGGSPSQGAGTAQHPGTTAPIPHGLVSGSFFSHRRGVEVGWTVSFPPGWTLGSRMPLCLVLHGFEANHTYAFDELDLQIPQAQLSGGSPARPMVLAAADGGNGYWHPHADGDDPQGMLMDEFLPMLEAMGVSTDHLVAFGWSMGG